MLKTLETIKSAVNKGPKEASINHWLYIVEITLITTIVFFAMLLVMAIFITDFGVLTDIKRLTWMLASFTLLPLLFAKRAKQLFFRFSFAQLSFQQACVFIAIKLLILIWLIFEYFTAVSHVAHAVTYHELALYLKGIKLPLLMIAVYLVLSYMGLIISNLFASLKVNSSKSIIRALIGANILLLAFFPFDFGRFNSETHFSVESLEAGIEQLNNSSNAEKSVIAVVPNAEELIEVMADVANSQSFLKLHYFSAEAKDPSWREIYSLRNKSFDPSAIAYELSSEKMTNFCWLLLQEISHGNRFDEHKGTIRKKMTNCIKMRFVTPINFFANLTSENHYLDGFAPKNAYSRRNVLMKSVSI